MGRRYGYGDGDVAVLHTAGVAALGVEGVRFGFAAVQRTAGDAGLSPDCPWW